MVTIKKKKQGKHERLPRVRTPRVLGADYRTEGVGSMCRSINQGERKGGACVTGRAQAEEWRKTRGWELKKSARSKRSTEF